MSLPFKVPEPEKHITVGNEQTGTFKVPVYNALLVGEALEIAKLFQRIAKDLKKPVQDISNEDIVNYKPHLALIAMRYRIPGGEKATLKYVQKLPWFIIDTLAQLMLGEIEADTLQRLKIFVEEDGDDDGGKEESAQPQN